MKTNLIFAGFIFACQSLFAAPGDRFINNSNQDKDIIFQVNKGGTTTEAMRAKGSTGGVAIRGTNTNDSAASGYVGEFLSSTINSTPIASNTNTNVTSLVLTAGEWDVQGVATSSRGSGGTRTHSWTYIDINDVSLTRTTDQVAMDATFTSDNISLATLTKRFQVPSGSTKTIYLIMETNFSGTTSNMAGTIRARRVR